ncbi:MAG: hypothetical protein FJX72_17505 [Armatimonadetes bacterium]|nr:hypothetical protein [Armatimonadota bacterium]
MKTIEVDFLADGCPCCKARRRSDAGDGWPWKCGCNHCEVVGMGRTCGGPGKCWDDCPYKAPDDPKAEG